MYYDAPFLSSRIHSYVVYTLHYAFEENKTTFLTLLQIFIVGLVSSKIEFSINMYKFFHLFSLCHSC